MDRVEKLKTYLQQNPNDSFLQHALALEYIKAGDDAQAKQLFQSILQHDPGYVGTYYHLAKLLVRNADPQAAISIYEQGMLQARKAGDNHAYNELQNAYEELVD